MASSFMWQLVQETQVLRGVVTWRPDFPIWGHFEFEQSVLEEPPLSV